jgi:hypothetical protein
MLNKFTITYSSGLTEEIQSSNETAELQSNATFGMGLAQATEMGCNVVLAETVEEDEEFEPTEGQIKSFTQEIETEARTDHDYGSDIVPGQKLTLTAVEGEDEAKAAIDGQSVAVLNAFPEGFQLELNLIEVDVNGLTATFVSEEPEPVEEPVPEVPDPEEEEDPNTVTFSHLTRATPTIGYVDDTDVKKIKLGDVLTLTAVAGLEDMMELADGRSGEVQVINGTSVQINIDLTDVDTTGLVMTTQVEGDPDAPDPGDTTGTITSFTAASPTEVTMDEQDTNMLSVGDMITLEALTGDPEAVTLIHEQRVQVMGKDPITLGIDLSLSNVTDLTADFTMDEAPAGRSTAKKTAKKKSKKRQEGRQDERQDDRHDKRQEERKGKKHKEQDPPSIMPQPPTDTRSPPWGQPSEPEQDRASVRNDPNQPPPPGGPGGSAPQRNK